MSRRLRCVRSGLPYLWVGLLVAAGVAHAQVDTPAKPELSAEERAQKQADKVFTFIKLQSVKPAAKRAAADAQVASPPTQVANMAPAKPTPKPQTKQTAAVAAGAGAGSGSGSGSGAGSVESRPSTTVAPDSRPLPDADSPAALLAAASLSAAAVQPELLPQPPVAQAEPEPPALQLLSKVEPEIPRQLHNDFKGGAVTVRFTVQTDGSVVQAQAMQSSHKRLALAAVAAVNQWRFAPLPSPREATVDIAFALE